ncbi:hypothetical protein Tco_0204735 [Tanacetum coccineum]
MDPNLDQKEDIYQVALDIIKNTPCYNAFIISADVYEIYMQQFWYIIKKVKKFSFYQFDLDNKTCQIDVELFREILDTCLNVQNQEFIVPPSHDSLMDFLLDLGYKGIYHKANVDYAALIWEDLQYQIDNRLSKVRRRDIMPYPRFTNVIIHYFMSKHKSISMRQGSLYNTDDNDGVLDRLKFNNKGDIYQVYGKSIPDTLITDEIKNSEAYKTFIGISTGLIPLKKRRGKSAQGTKAIVIPKKATEASKKKKPKKKVSIRNESIDEESEEEE